MLRARTPQRLRRRRRRQPSSPASTRPRRISSTRQAARRSASGSGWRISELENVTKTFGEHARSTTSTSTSPTASSSSCSGQTGAGKTTTLRLIAGLDKPTEGRVIIDGQDVADWGPPSATSRWCCSNIRSIRATRCGENLEFPLKSQIRSVEPEPRSTSASTASAKTLRIEHLLDRKTDRLSGGEMQRVSIGRAIVRKPRVFLMDEPLSALDAKLREALRTELKNLQMKLGATFLFVTHDQIEAMSMGDKIGVLNHGQLVQIGTPQRDLHQPARHLRRRLRRLAADEPAQRQARLGGRADHAGRAFELPLTARPAPGPTGGQAAHLRHPSRRTCVLESGAPVEARVHERREPRRREDRHAPRRRKTDPLRRCLHAWSSSSTNRSGSAGIPRRSCCSIATAE